MTAVVGLRVAPNQDRLGKVEWRKRLCKTQSFGWSVWNRSPGSPQHSPIPSACPRASATQRPAGASAKLRGAHAPCGASPATQDNERRAQGAGRAATAGAGSWAAAPGRCARLLRGRQRWLALCALECGLFSQRARPLGPQRPPEVTRGGRAALPIGRAGWGNEETSCRRRSPPAAAVAGVGARARSAVPRAGSEPRQRRRRPPRSGPASPGQEAAASVAARGSPGLSGRGSSFADAAREAAGAEETAPGASAHPPAPPPSRLGRSCGPGGRRRRRRPARRGGPRPACQATRPARLRPRAAPDAKALPPGPCSRRRSRTSSSAKRTVRNGGDCWSRPCGRSVPVPGRPWGPREVPGRPRSVGWAVRLAGGWGGGWGLPGSGPCELLTGLLHVLPVLGSCGPSFCSVAGCGGFRIACCIQKDVFSSFCLAPEGRFCYDHKNGFHVAVISSGNFRRWPICCPQAGLGQEKVFSGVYIVSETKVHFQAW